MKTRSSSLCPNRNPNLKGRRGNRGMLDLHQVIEEPYEAKVSRTVLKTNGFREELVEFNIWAAFIYSYGFCAQQVSG